MHTPNFVPRSWCPCRFVEVNNIYFLHRNVPTTTLNVAFFIYLCALRVRASCKCVQIHLFIIVVDRQCIVQLHFECGCWHLISISNHFGFSFISVVIQAMTPAYRMCRRHGSICHQHRAVWRRFVVKYKLKLMLHWHTWQWAPTLHKTQSIGQVSRTSSSNQPAKNVNMPTNWLNICWCAANWSTMFPTWSKSM